MKAPLRSRPRNFQRTKLASPRLLGELFRALVAAAAPVALLGAAGFACGASGPFGPGRDDYRCEASSHLQPQYDECPSAAEEQVSTGEARTMAVAGDAPVAREPSNQVAEASCEDRCRPFVERRGRRIEAGCSSDECCSVSGDPGGRCVVQCFTMVHQACGRRPSGLLAARRGDARAKKTRSEDLNANAPERVVGDYLAGAAELEAASVTAFEFLAGELEAHGAPADLIAAARKSGQEERRHTRSMSALAKRFGGEFKAPRVRARRPRSLRAMAIENAVEGCVREAFGALVATHQAACASDARVRRAMRKIAVDETSHAALAFRVGAWIEGRLDAMAARSVRASIRRAGKRLLRDAATPVHPALARELGLPRPEAALKMARGLLEALERSAA